MGFLGSVCDAIGSAASSVVHGVEDAASAVGNAVGSAASSVEHVGETFAKDTFGVIKGAADWTIHGVEDVGRDVEDGVEAVGRKAGNLFSRAAHAVGSAISDTVKGIGQGIADVAQGVVDGVLKFGKGLFVDGIGGFFSHLFQGDVKGAFGALIGGLDKAFLQAPMSIVNGVINGVQDAADGLTHLLPGPIGDFARQVVDRGADIIRTGANTVGELARDVYRFATETPLNFASDLYDAGKALVHGDWKNAIAHLGLAFIHVGTHALNTATDAVLRTVQGAASITLEATGFQAPSRKLTDAEKAALREVYGDSVDLDAIRISEGGPANNLGADHTIGNTIYLNDGESSKPDFMSTLIHETAHVWQSQNGGGEYIGQSVYNQIMASLSGGSRDGAYDYTAAVAAGVPFENLNPEQQAEYIQEVLGPILTQPGDAETNLKNSSLAADPKALAYAESVLHDILSGSGAA